MGNEGTKAENGTCWNSLGGKTIPACFVYIMILYQMLDQVGTLTGKHVDDGDLYHRVAAGLLA